MLFGEIVEPSTRALIDDELEYLPEYQEPVLEWDGNPEAPNEIETLVLVESDKILKLCTCLLSEKKPIAKLKNEGLEIHIIGKNSIVLFSGTKNLVCGQIVEILSTWISKAKNIYAITSSAIALYQNDALNEKPVSLTRCLTNNLRVPFDFCPILEAPNLVTGLGADVLSFCIHNNIKCSVFVMYLDYSPLDSVTSRPIVELLEKIGVSGKIDLKISDSSSNLYM